MNVNVIPYNRLFEICDENYTVEDIARLSHVPCRKVVFDREFTKNLFGNYIVFDAKTGEKAYKNIYNSILNRDVLEAE
jgi:hypothetical protein